MDTERLPGGTALLAVGQLMSSAVNTLAELAQVTLRVTGLVEQQPARAYKVRTDLAFGAGGADRQVRRAFARGLVNALRSEGHEVELVGSLADGTVSLWITVEATDSATAVERAEKDVMGATHQAFQHADTAFEDVNLTGAEALQLALR